MRVHLILFPTTFIISICGDPCLFAEEHIQVRGRQKKKKKQQASFLSLIITTYLLVSSRTEEGKRRRHAITAQATSFFFVGQQINLCHIRSGLLARSLACSSNFYGPHLNDNIKPAAPFYRPAWSKGEARKKRSEGLTAWLTDWLRYCLLETHKRPSSLFHDQVVRYHWLIRERQSQQAGRSYFYFYYNYYKTKREGNAHACGKSSVSALRTKEKKR